MKTSHVLFTGGENGQYEEKRDDTARIVLDDPQEGKDVLP